jgi:hypothetical protein
MNYADYLDTDGLRHPPKKKKITGIQRGDPSSKWSHGSMPAPVLVRIKAAVSSSSVIFSDCQSKFAEGDPS